MLYMCIRAIIVVNYNDFYEKLGSIDLHNSI